MDNDLEPIGLAVVTGASSGIGLEIARALGARGFELLLVAGDEGVDFVARSMRAGGTEADAVRADLATASGVEEVYANVVERGELVEILVLSAGPGPAGAFLRNPLEPDVDIITRNCISVVHLAKRLLPAMVNAGSGHVLIASPAVSSGLAGLDTVYAATRAFLLAFAHLLREELKGTGVTVTALHPGMSDTSFLERTERPAMAAVRPGSASHSV